METLNGRREENMIINIEGMPSAGKTSLAEDICRKTGAIYRSFGNYEPHGNGPRIWAEELEWAWECDSPVVFDQLHWSEVVLGPLYRDGSDLSWGEFMALNDMAHQMGVLHVLLMVDPGEAERRLRSGRSEAERYVDPADLVAIRDGYCSALGHAMTDSAIPMLRINNDAMLTAKEEFQDGLISQAVNLWGHFNGD